MSFKALGISFASRFFLNKMAGKDTTTAFRQAGVASITDNYISSPVLSETLKNAAEVYAQTKDAIALVPDEVLDDADAPESRKVDMTMDDILDLDDMIAGLQEVRDNAITEICHGECQV